MLIYPKCDPNQTRVWIDVGAHMGERTFQHAKDDARLREYAFEPNLRVIRDRIGALPNFVVLPMAVTETDGGVDFYLNRFAAASSVLPFDPEGLALWAGGEVLAVEEKLTVCSSRLDSFLELMDIRDVEFLKIDAQGADLAVVRSAGRRIRDVARVALEVQINPVPLYARGSEKATVLDYMTTAGFQLESVEKQSLGQEENLVFVRNIAP